MTDQAKDEPIGNRTRVCVYLPKDLADELREIVKDLPFGATISGFAETALRDAISRVKAEGVHVYPRK